MKRLLLMFSLHLGLTATEVPTGSVIFLHPDGASISSWMATRFLHAGPDGLLHWDRLPHVAIYDGRLADALSASSNGGATTHAWGVRAPHGAFGFVDPDARALSGFSGPLMREAQAAGRAVGIVQTGAHYEPGTAIFLTSSAGRADLEEISAALVELGGEVMLGGGEAWFLPDGHVGRHGPGLRKDGRNLVEEARRVGYIVLFTRDELLAHAPEPGERVLGLFAHDHTFNHHSEEDLRAGGLPAYQPQAPSYAEMIAYALRLLARHPSGFLLVAEEEGTDNFANKNNAAATIEAHRRADEGVGVARAFVAEHPNTLLLVASDSNAGSMALSGPRVGRLDPAAPLPPREPNGAPIDGRYGTGTPPFLSLPNREGNQLPFWIAWGSRDDTSGGVVTRAEGLNAGLIRGNVDNIDLYRVMHFTLFGRKLPQL